MTKQEIFDKVATHLLKQRRKSVRDPDSGDVACAYRSVNGDKCAIGCLIKDRVYDPVMEGRDIGSLVLNWGDKLPKYFQIYTYFLSKLQNIHDNRKVTEWPDWLKMLADEEELDTSCIDKYLK